jgi:hypothetical protein
LSHRTEIYSLGTGTCQLGEFMEILKAYAIEVAADVRPLSSFPQSGTLPFPQRGGGWEIRHIIGAGKV